MKLFDLEGFRNEIHIKIKTLIETLNFYKYKNDPHSYHMRTIINEEIATLQWALKSTYKHEMEQGK